MAKRVRSRQQAASQLRIAELVVKAIDGIEQKLGGTDVSLTDFLKVMQLQKELEEAQPEEVKVTWVDAKSKKET